MPGAWAGDRHDQHFFVGLRDRGAAAAAAGAATRPHGPVGKRIVGRTATGPAVAIQTEGFSVWTKDQLHELVRQPERTDHGRLRGANLILCATRPANASRAYFFEVFAAVNTLFGIRTWTPTLGLSTSCVIATLPAMLVT
jgi:hypothetical protein